MKFVLFALILGVSLICPGQNPADPPPPPPLPPSGPLPRLVKRKVPVRDGLENYFSDTEIRPRIIVNNLDPEEFREGGEIIVGDYRIKWMRSDFDAVRIDIAGDVFSLAGKLSLNHLETEENDRMREVDFADMWRQVKLYEFGDRKLIGLSMYNFPCTGTGCSLSFYLVYDLQTKKKTFFGSYRIPGDLRLFDFENDGILDYPAAIYSGDKNAAAAREILDIYELYTMDENGNFTPRSDKKGRKYFLKRTFNADTGDEIDSKFVMNWPEEMKFYRYIIKSRKIH